MSDTLGSLRRKITTAGDLKSVVSSMKAMAAACIGQYEKSVLALKDYERTVELGLTVCWRNQTGFLQTPKPNPDEAIGAVVFGSDQGLVGQFNDVLTDFVVKTFESVPGPKKVWVLGEKIVSRLTEVGLTPVKMFPVPSSVNAIAPLVGQVLLETETSRTDGKISQLIIFHNQPRSRTVYEPVSRQLLPLDKKWTSQLALRKWPTNNLPVVLGETPPTLLSFTREFLFVSLFQACAESLAAENGSRLAAMERAEKNIDEMVVTLNQKFHRLRQASIDEELFDVVSGYEALFRKTQKY